MATESRLFSVLRFLVLTATSTVYTPNSMVKTANAHSMGDHSLHSVQLVEFI